MTIHYIEPLKRWKSSQFPVVPGTRCLEIIIPDDDAYARAIAGLYSLMTKPFNFEGTDEQRAEIAEMVNAAYTATDWEGCMTCDDVLDCIENDGAVQDAIRNLYNPTSTNAPIPPGTLSENLLPDNPGCDLDILWGGIVNLIDNMNINNQDAQQLLESTSNVGERISKFISGIPIFGILPVDEVIDYAQSLWSDDAFEAYLANDTTAYREELMCDLFCIAQSKGCSLSLDDVGEYFSMRLSSDWTDTVADVLLYLTAGVWTGTEINDGFYLAQTVVLKGGNKFFEMVGLSSFKVYLATGTPNDDHLLLCEACPEFWCYAWNFRSSEGDWIKEDLDPPGISAYWLDGLGWIPEAGGNGTYIVFNKGSEADGITSVRVTYTSDHAFTLYVVSFTSFTSPSIYTGNVTHSLDVEAGEDVTVEIDVSDTALTATAWDIETLGDVPVHAAEFLGNGTLPDDFTGGEEC